MIRLTELNNNLPKIIRMPRQVKEALVTDLALIPRRPEPELLRIAHTLHHHPNGIQDHAGDVPACSERRLGVLLDIGRVEDRHGQGDGPDPDHLEDPESEKGPELVSFVIKTVIFSRLKNSE